MEALRASSVGVLASTRGASGEAAVVEGGRNSVRFSSGAVLGGAFRNQVAGSGAGWARKRNGDCTCVAAAATEASADEFVSTMGGRTLYGVLGVELGGSFSEIKSAYKQMARRYHPDVCPLDDHNSCTQKFLEVRHAYEVLSDPAKRAEYDYALMHPSFAQALGSSSKAWSRSRRTQGSEGVSEAWRFQWEAQLSRLRRDSQVKSSSPVSNANSWGARMRREKSEH